MFDALGADQSVGNLLYHARFSSDYQNFQAIIVIQVDVQGGKYVVEMRMLQAGQLFIEQPDVVVVHQRHGAYHAAIRTLPSVLH